MYESRYRSDFDVDSWPEDRVPSLASTLHHHHQSKHGSSSTITDDDSSRGITTTSSPGLQPTTDFMVTCPQCHMRLNGFENVQEKCTYFVASSQHIPPKDNKQPPVINSPISVKLSTTNKSLRDHIAIEHPHDKLNIEPSFPSPREDSHLQHRLGQQQPQQQQRHLNGTADSDDNESNLSSLADNKSYNNNNNNNNNNNSQMKNNNIDLRTSPPNSVNNSPSRTSLTELTTTVAATTAVTATPGSTGGSDNNSATSTSTNNGPYQCMHCTALFQTRDQLEKHELMHSPNAQSPQSSQPQNGVNQKRLNTIGSVGYRQP
uniref:C2H2-type domain-containing protein n=1 Tax=Glossina pallidipes TaxID=7398 RepID=A0A1A9ZZP4_GLOPL